MNMTKRLTELLFIASLLSVSYPVACHAANYSEVEGSLKKMQSKQTITALLGRPHEKSMHVKRNKFIWGPQEEFWDEIPMETRLEVWKYEFSDGILNLYFIDAGERLDYKAFTPKGVVY